MIGNIFKDTSSCQFKRKGDVFLHIANQVCTPVIRVKKTMDVKINKSKNLKLRKAVLNVLPPKLLFINNPLTII